MLDLAYELSPALRSFLHVHRSSSSYSVRDGGASSAFSSLALACNRSSSSYSPCVEGSTPPTAAADAAGARDGARDRNRRHGCNDAAGGAAPCAVAAGCCGYCGGAHCLGTGLSFSVRRERQFGKHWPDPLRHCPQRWCLNTWKTRYPLPWYLLWQSQARLERHVLQQAPYMRGALSGGAVCGCGSVCCGAGGGRIP